ncbi:EamA family transporter RarD [Comamonas guangdongensis]|uniref:EamA family transporter RarD n=1 Tax=Comamonas guangdongensis TaxID=510515 RepID=A0ABV3ZZP8_9BURK
MFKGVVVSTLASVLFASLYYLSPFLAPLDGEQIFGWRVLMTLPFTTALLFALKQAEAVRALLARSLAWPRFGLLLVLSAALLGVQLWMFMWAPMNGRALPVSLGYFLLPLVMVVAGRLLFAERLTPGQTLAALVAAAGVAHEFWQAGGMSWETWVVALGYTLYFALRRWLKTDTLAGHWLDMALLLPAALVFVLRAPGRWPLVAGHEALWALLPLLGVVSAVALALYMVASRWLSYVEPALLVVVAGLLGERLQPQQLPTYGLIFAAVGLLMVDGVWHLWRGRSGNVY